MTNDKQLAVKMAIDLWNSRLKATDEMINALTDEQLQKEVSPGRNRGVYILGHLTAVHDWMLPQLGFGKQLHPELDEIFIKQPDKAVKEISSVKDLRNNWKNVNTKLNDHFNKVQAEEWFERHTLVSPEDFEKAPNRN